MKKLLIIVLLVCMCVSVVYVGSVLAEVKFGNWDKWDEILPSADNEYWYWAIYSNESRTWNLKGFGDSDNDVIVLLSDLYFYGDKKGKTKSSVIFYSQGGNIDLKDWDIPNASLALVAFPPKQGKMVVRAYKMEDKVFKFFEEWEIIFKEHEIVVPKEMKFRQVFKQWLAKQISPERTIPEDLVERMLPELVIWEKKSFMITDCQKLSKNK